MRRGPNVLSSKLPGFDAAESAPKEPTSSRDSSASPEPFASILKNTKLAAAQYSSPIDISENPTSGTAGVSQGKISSEENARAIRQQFTNLKKDGMDIGLSSSQQALLEEMALACDTQAELDELLADPELHHLLALQELKDVADTPEPILSSLVVPGRAMYPPIFHEAKWKIPVATITFKGYDTKRLELFTHFATHAASALGIPTSGVYPLPNQRRLWTVLRSPFVFKKTQQNFERITHARGVKAWDATEEVVDMWAKVLMTHAMPGVGVKITRWNRMEVGVGAKELGKVEAEIQGVLDRRSGVAERVRQVSEQIVAQETAHLEADAKGNADASL
ncbi:hypothetical protein HWV62_20408 [Athelia sp. TMB]|nr:hypothetical protein HWV62_14202 [Athelia sp. TMB]KAF7986791.1 hypothetical protein HWV62_20408 [Athelia sp. TMB]